MGLFSRSTANKSFINKRERIQSWLMQEEWRIAEVQLPNMTWCITGTNELGYSIIVAQPTQPVDRTFVEAAVTIDATHQALILAMEPKQRQDLWWRMRLALLQMGLDYNGFNEPVQSITISQRIYDDSLCKDTFLQRVSHVKRGQSLVLQMIGRALQQPPDDDILNADSLL